MNPTVGSSQESPRAPEKRPAVPRFRHPPPAPRSEEAEGMEPAKVGEKGWTVGNLWEIFGKDVFKMLVFCKQTQRANKKGLKLNWACCDIPGKLAEERNWTEGFWTSCYENLTLKHRYRSCTCRGPWFISWNVICWPRISSKLLLSKFMKEDTNQET